MMPVWGESCKYYLDRGESMIAYTTASSPAFKQCSGKKLSQSPSFSNLKSQQDNEDVVRERRESHLCTKGSFLRCGSPPARRLLSGHPVMPIRYPLLLWLASPAAACLYCFSNGAQRLRVCQYFLGHQSVEHEACLKALMVAFEPYLATKVDMAEIAKLKDTFNRILFFMEEKGVANVPYRIGIREATEKIKDEVKQLKRVVAVAVKELRTSGNKALALSRLLNK
ncbi:uncharacterized protein LOC121915523 [Sceloporus undulatus]|uniref:uncharacterized protein LOC121915523 n=1 Tax=Sceloporus undulatus TaxID=8520 RepID=UPI001C4B348C|nr:uncharacterized protein LOC121915523 [Sceloporus undulatus]